MLSGAINMLEGNKETYVVAHNASFDVARLNHTAHCHGLRGLPPLCSADMLCTMHGATKHCRLRTRGDKRLKPPRNEELYKFLFSLIAHPPGACIVRCLTVV